MKTDSSIFPKVVFRPSGLSSFAPENLLALEEARPHMLALLDLANRMSPGARSVSTQFPGGMLIAHAPQPKK